MKRATKPRYPGPPPAGSAWGRCHQDAIAYVLDLPLSAVPHFADDGCDAAEFYRREREFLRSRGLVPINFWFPPQDRADEVAAILRCVGEWNPGAIHLFGGVTRALSQPTHTVVCRDGAVIHDYAPDVGGIIGPLPFGFYAVTFFGSAAVSDGPPPPRAGATRARRRAHSRHASGPA